MFQFGCYARSSNHNLNYDPEAGPLETFRRFQNTVLPSVFTRCEFWVLFAIHLLFFLRSYSMGASEGEANNEFMDMTDRGLKVITAMTTIFEVFFTNQCYTRYLQLFNSTRSLLAETHTFSFTLRSYLTEPELRGHIRLAIRFLLTSLRLFFCEINGTVLSAAEWQECVSKGFLRPRERDFLMAHAPLERQQILLHWCAQVSALAIAKSKCQPNAVRDVINRLISVSLTQQNLQAVEMLPVPFPYFHLLNMMVFVNLMLWAYALGTRNSVFSAVSFFFIEVIIIGIMEMASQLADPFGEDEVDFPVSTWTASCIDSCLAFVEHEYGPAADNWREILQSEHQAPTLQSQRSAAPSAKGSFHVRKPRRGGPSDKFLYAHLPTSEELT